MNKYILTLSLLCGLIPTFNASAASPLCLEGYEDGITGNCLIFDATLAPHVSAETDLSLAGAANFFKWHHVIYLSLSGTGDSNSASAWPYAVEPVSISVADPAVFTVDSNTLAVDDAVIFQTSNTLPDGLTAGTTYYVTAVSGDTFTVSATVSGSDIATSGTQTGNHTVSKGPVNTACSPPAGPYRYGYTDDGANCIATRTLFDFVDTPQAAVTISVADPGVVTWTNHERSVNDPVIFLTDGALPTGLTAHVVYYVKTVLDDDTFTVSATPGGTAITTTGTPSGSHSALLYSTAYTYTGFGTSTPKAWANKATPVLKEGFELGVSRPWLTRLRYPESGTFESNWTPRKRAIDAIAASGAKSLRIELDAYGSNLANVVYLLNYVDDHYPDMGVLIAFSTPDVLSQEQVAVCSNGTCTYQDNSPTGTDWTITEDGKPLGEIYMGICGYGVRPRKFSDIVVATFEEALETDILPDLAEFKNIIGFEIGNELDSICFNGDIPFPANDNTGATLDFAGDLDPDITDSFTTRYTAVTTQLKTSLDAQVVSGTAPWLSPDTRIVSFGAAQSYQYWSIYGTDSGSPYYSFTQDLYRNGWNAPALLHDILSDEDANAAITVIGEHIYPLTEIVKDDMKAILYDALNDPILTEIDGFEEKEVWLTEWGFNKGPIWPNLPDPFRRYRAMMEVMAHVNTDSNPAAQKITRTFLYGFDYCDADSCPPQSDYRIYRSVNDHLVPQMPEARILKAYTGGRIDHPSANPYDSDSDGLSDTYEVMIGTQPLNSDSDSDGLLDGAEDVDTDGDGLSDVYENTISETDPMEKDSDEDGLPDDWALITLPGTSPVDLENPDLFFNAAGEHSTTRESDTVYDYHEFYYDGNASLSAAAEEIETPTACEMAIEFWKPVNWSGKKALVMYYPGGWAPELSRDSYGKQSTMARNDATDGLWQAPGPYELKSGVFGNISYWLDNDYAIYVPSFRALGEESDCAGSANANALVTWKEVVHDAQEAFYHIVLTSKLIADDQSTDFPTITLFGLSAGAHLTGVLATHGLDQLELTVPGAPWDGVQSQGRTAISAVFNGATPSHVKIMQDHFNNDPFVAANRELNVSDIDPPEIQYTSELNTSARLPHYTTFWCGDEGEGDCTTANFKALPATDPFISYNTLGNYYSSTYSPRMLLIHGTADADAAPEESIAFCHAIAVAAGTQSDFDQTVTLGNAHHQLVTCDDAEDEYGSRAVFIDGFPHIGNFVFPLSQDVVAEYYFNQHTIRRWIEKDLFDANDNDMSDSWERHYALDRHDLDSDGDTTPNDEDSDNDNDGVSDLVEYQQGMNPRSTDTDTDSIADNQDNCPIDANNDQLNTDNDTAGDVCDRDDDADEVLDVNDNCRLAVNPLQHDLDEDEYGNACDGDINNDDIVNDLDLSILASTAGYGGYSHIEIFPGIPEIAVPYLLKSTSDIDQELFYQWIYQGSAYAPGPSGLNP